MELELAWDVSVDEGGHVGSGWVSLGAGVLCSFGGGFESLFS